MKINSFKLPVLNYHLTEKYSTASLLFFSVLFISLFSRGFEYFNKLYYLFPILLSLGTIIHLKEKGICILSKQILYFIPFIVWIMISSLWSYHPFLSLIRSLYFLFLIVGLLSLIQIAKLNTAKIFISFAPVITLIVLSSLFLIFYDFTGESWSGGNGKGFMGIASHQNTLGMILFFLCAIMNYYYLSYYKKGKLYSSLLLILSILLLLLLIFTFSRASILSYLIFLLVFISLLKRSKKYFMFLSALVIIIPLLVQLFFPNHLLNYMIFKGDNELLASRSAMINASLEASKSGGFWGIGYGVSDPKIVHEVPGKFQKGIFIREKGSTALALIEETGLIGLIFFYLPLFYLGYHILLKKKLSILYSSESISSERNVIIFLISILIALTAHSQFEAWGVGVGSIMLPIYLLFQILLLEITDNIESSNKIASS